MLDIILFKPILIGIIMFFIAKPNIRRMLLVGTALAHLGLSIFIYFEVVEKNVHLNSYLFGDALSPDALGVLFLLIVSILFLATSFYAVGYLRNEEKLAHIRNDFVDGTFFSNSPEQRFMACLCFFLASMTIVTTSAHIGLLWFGIELTTLSCAPLIYFHRNKRSLEAAWKYLIICSVGIALALLANILFMLAFSKLGAISNAMPALLDLASILKSSEYAQYIPWFKVSFIFLLVGYGTKMGLAPLHNWLPDAHSQAPSMISALLSGALLNCAFLGILRGHQIMIAAGLQEFSGGLLVFFGLLSMLFAAIFIIGQGEFKRLLAYSSVEHMGILALGVGIGGSAVFASMLHAVNHSFTKAMLFLLAGNIVSHYHTNSSHDVKGMNYVMPLTSFLWLIGFLAIAGSPPFGLFVSEFSILKTMLDNNSWFMVTVYLTILFVIFIGMSIPILRMVQGKNSSSIEAKYDENKYNIAPSMVLGLIVLILGVYIPNWLVDFLNKAAQLIGG